MPKLPCLLFLLLVIYDAAGDEPLPVSVRVESCPGCSLNRLPEVKKFIYEDLPLYNIEFKRIHGAPPELVLLDKDNEEFDRIPLSQRTRAECNELLQMNGFFKKEDKPEKNEF